MASTKSVILPNTKLIQEARHEVEARLPESIRNHSNRTYLLGRAWANKEGRSFDEEGLYLAALFHDLGLTAAPPPGLSFQEFGAAELYRFGKTHGLPAERAKTLADAILYHMQLFPRWDKGPEAGILQIGAWMDVMFLRRWNFAQQARYFEELYPRGDLWREFPRRVLQSVKSIHSCTGIMAPKENLYAH